MRRRHYVYALAGIALLLFVGGGVIAYRTFHRFKPSAITLGPETTIYFQSDPPLNTRVHEAIHRRQMREKSFLGRLLSAMRYNFDYAYRLDEEAEAKAGELCLQVHRFSEELPSYTTSRSRRQAQAYRAWAWERVGLDVPDRVGRYLEGGQRCARILRGVKLDFPPGERLSEEEEVRLAAFHFLQSFGSGPQEMNQWRARLRLAGYADPVSWDVQADRAGFHLVPLGRAEAAEADTSISPRQAGEALHRLTYYRAERMYTQLRRPHFRYRGPVLLDREEIEEEVETPPERWPSELFPRALEGELDEEQVDYLRRMAAHPVHRDFLVFALAPDADIVGTRYRLSLDSAGVAWNRMVLTELEPIRDAFLAQWGRAALAAHEGDLEEAERILRTVVSGSLQLAENSPFELDAIVGLDVLRAALASLRAVVDARWALAPEDEEPGDSLPDPPPVPTEEEIREYWAPAHRQALYSDDPVEIFRVLPELTADPTIPHAVRRFAYRQVMLFDVCLSERTRGAGKRSHESWRREVEAGLIRRDSDRALLDRYRGTVSDLLEQSGLEPSEICEPERVVQPRARIAILTAPPRSRSVAD